jgi:hypothetical protein
MMLETCIIRAMEYESPRPLQCELLDKMKENCLQKTGKEIEDLCESDLLTSASSETQCR